MNIGVANQWPLMGDFGTPTDATFSGHVTVMTEPELIQPDTWYDVALV